MIRERQTTAITLSSEQSVSVVIASNFGGNLFSRSREYLVIWLGLDRKIEDPENFERLNLDDLGIWSEIKTNSDRTFQGYIVFNAQYSVRFKSDTENSKMINIDSEKEFCKFCFSYNGISKSRC